VAAVSHKLILVLMGEDLDLLFHAFKSCGGGLIGATAKVVDVKSGQIVWMGQAEAHDFTLVDASQRIIVID